MVPSVLRVEEVAGAVVVSLTDARASELVLVRSTARATVSPGSTPVAGTLMRFPAPLAASAICTTPVETVALDDVVEV